jgi:hypothetical protein
MNQSAFADTQGQSTPVFAFIYLLGINLMPRIRNWKDLCFFDALRKNDTAHCLAKPLQERTQKYSMARWSSPEAWYTYEVTLCLPEERRRGATVVNLNLAQPDAMTSWAQKASAQPATWAHRLAACDRKRVTGRRDIPTPGASPNNLAWILFTHRDQDRGSRRKPLKGQSR